MSSSRGINTEICRKSVSAAFYTLFQGGTLRPRGHTHTHHIIQKIFNNIMQYNKIYFIVLTYNILYDIIQYMKGALNINLYSPFNFKSEGDFFMKAKVKRVQPNQVDFSVLTPDMVNLYIWGCVGSLVSTISNQCLYDPQLVVDAIHSYVVSFDPKNYLPEARADIAAFETRCKEIFGG